MKAKNGVSVVCPSCGMGRGVFVWDTRKFADGKTLRRRRRCGSCEHEWTTFELDKDSLEFIRDVQKDMLKRLPLGHENEPARKRLMKAIDLLVIGYAEPYALNQPLMWETDDVRK